MSQERESEREGGIKKERGQMIEGEQELKEARELNRRERTR
jgi:hypothetical protein